MSTLLQRLRILVHLLPHWLGPQIDHRRHGLLGVEGGAWLREHRVLEGVRRGCGCGRDCVVGGLVATSSAQGICRQEIGRGVEADLAAEARNRFLLRLFAEAGSRDHESGVTLDQDLGAPRHHPLPFRHLALHLRHLPRHGLLFLRQFPGHRLLLLRHLPGHRHLLFSQLGLPLLDHVELLLLLVLFHPPERPQLFQGELGGALVHLLLAVHGPLGGISWLKQRHRTPQLPASLLPRAQDPGLCCQKVPLWRVGRLGQVGLLVHREGGLRVLRDAVQGNVGAALHHLGLGPRPRLHLVLLGVGPGGKIFIWRNIFLRKYFFCGGKKKENLEILKEGRFGSFKG